MAEIHELTLHPSSGAPEGGSIALTARAHIHFLPEECALKLRYRLHVFLIDGSLKAVPQVRGGWREAAIFDGRSGRSLPHLAYASEDVIPDRQKVVARLGLPEVVLPAGVRIMGMLVSCLSPDQCLSQPYFRKMRLI